MHKIFLSFMMILLPMTANATTLYYIDPAGTQGTPGNDAFNGTSPSTPWATCTPLQGINFLKPGDFTNIAFGNIFQGSNAHCLVSSAGANGYTFNVTSANATATAVYSNNGVNFTVTSTISGGTTLSTTTLTSGTLPLSSGNLTKVSGLGDTTITYSSVTFQYLPITMQSWGTATVNFNVLPAHAAIGDIYSINSNNYTVTTAITGGTILIATGLLSNGNYPPVVNIVNPLNQVLTKVSGAGDATISYSGYTVNNPVFDGSVSTSTVSGWTGWTLYDAPNHIWVSNVVVPFLVNGIIVDNSFSLGGLNRNDQTETTLQTINLNRYYQSAANQVIYVVFADDSDPNTHTIYFNANNFGSTQSLVGTDNNHGSYINWNGIGVQGSNFFGFRSYGTNVNILNSAFKFNAREGVAFSEVGRQNTTGSAFNTCTNCDVEGNSAGLLDQGVGQGFTTESNNVIIKNSIIKNNWMAGGDFLNYSLGITNAINEQLIGSLIQDNSLRSVQAGDDGFDPIGFYNDCASNVQIINNVFIASVTHQEGTSYFSNGCEHPTLYTNVGNNDVINNLFYGATQFAVVTSGALNCSGSACNVFSNLRFIGNTFAAPSTFGMMHMTNLNPNGAGVIFENNIVDAVGSGSANYLWTFLTSPLMSNFNTYFSSNSAAFYFTGGGDGSYSTWKSSTGQDSNSQFSDPLFVTGSLGNYYLSHIATGQSSNSPAVGVGGFSLLGNQYVFATPGSTRTDNVADTTNPPDEGYHYNISYTSSTFTPTTGPTVYR